MPGMQCCCGAVSGGDAGASAANSDAVSLLVPAYIWPDPGVYSQLAEAGPSAIVIITGANSGPPEPGHPRTDLYRRTFGQLASSGVRLIGYVHTSYGQRPLQEVIQAVQHWYAGYGECLSGIFVDEASCKATHESVTYSAALRKSVKAHGDQQLLALNPGTAIDAQLAQQADIVLTFEDTWDMWLREPKSSRRGRVAAGGSGAQPAPAVAVHGTSVLSAAEVTAQLRRAQQLGYAYAFFTDAALPNPWGTLPAYWQQLVAAVR